MLIDTDVLIWPTRGSLRAAQRLQRLAPWRISTVTYIELAQGCRNKSELVRPTTARGSLPAPVIAALLCEGRWSFQAWPRALASTVRGGDSPDRRLQR